MTSKAKAKTRQLDDDIEAEMKCTRIPLLSTSKTRVAYQLYASRQQADRHTDTEKAWCKMTPEEKKPWFDALTECRCEAKVMDSCARPGCNAAWEMKLEDKYPNCQGCPVHEQYWPDWSPESRMCVSCIGAGWKMKFTHRDGMPECASPERSFYRDGDRLCVIL